MEPAAVVALMGLFMTPIYFALAKIYNAVTGLRRRVDEIEDEVGINA